MVRPKLEHPVVGYVIATSYKHEKIAHHPDCSVIATTPYVKDQLVLVIPEDAYICQRCKCKSKRERQQIKNAKRKSRRNMYRVNIHHVKMTRHPTKWHWVIEVVKCPKCGSDNVAKEVSSWLCWDCDWLGSIPRSEIIEQWRQLNATDFQDREANEASDRCGPSE